MTVPNFSGPLPASLSPEQRSWLRRVLAGEEPLVGTVEPSPTRWSLPLAAGNERITENLVRDALRTHGFYGDTAVRVEEQRSTVAEVRRLLRNASKSGSGRLGSPEFIITSPGTPDFLIVIECKASPDRHQSAELNRPVDFAVDGALSYARSLSESYHVIAIGASGQSVADFRISTYLHPRGAGSPRLLTAKSGTDIDKIVSWSDYISSAQYDPAVERARVNDLIAFSKALHEFMRDYAKLTENEKPLLVSGTLLALMHAPFATAYLTYTPAQLQKAWLRAITDIIDSADIPRAKKDAMVQPYSHISVHPTLGRPTERHPRGVLSILIRMLAERVLPLLNVYGDYDVVGQFYGQFLKYTGGDGKSLGIVLTPRHITDLFARLSNVTKRDIVVDTCCGTGGFLISAMSRMLESTVTDAEIRDIQRNRLIGVEHLPNMFTLAASNMIFRGDGKANLYLGDCFDPSIQSEIRSLHPNIGLINPPYAQTGESLSELNFVQGLLSVLKVGGLAIAIVPMTCATAPSAQKRELLREHTLEAVMSMPNEVFYPVGVITCIMVFRAHIPHATTNRKTWFGFWKDDGFVKTKHRGRVDLDNRWPEIRDQWVADFHNREVHPSRSVMHSVTASDEWCAEAYLETDYDSLTEREFMQVIREYAVYRMLEETRGEPE